MNRDDLRYLLEAHFHEDWDEDAPTWQGVVEFFVERHPGVAHAVGAMGECSLVLASPLAEGERLYEEFNTAFAPPSHLTVRAWLFELRDEIARACVRIDRIPPSAQADLSVALRQVGMQLSRGQPFDLDRASDFGASAPIDEVIVLLGSVSLVLIADPPADDPSGSTLCELRAAITSASVGRWARTARYL